MSKVLPRLGNFYAFTPSLRDDEELVGIREATLVGELYRIEMAEDERVIGVDGKRYGPRPYNAGSRKYKLEVPWRYIVRKVAPPEHFVQVQYANSGTTRSYTYRDPSGTLAVGDLVEVDARGGTSFGKVVALGRGSYPGTIKDVVAKLGREELAA